MTEQEWAEREYNQQRGTGCRRGAAIVALAILALLTFVIGGRR